MTEKDLQNIIFDYSQMSVDSLIDLKNLVEDYPYSQSVQILYLLNLKRLGEDIFDTRLPYTAICVNDRQKLKRSVEQVENISTNQKSKIKNQKSTELTFRSKTISELLNLQKPKPTPVAKPTPPQTQQTNDDKLLEQLRLEALAKVNDRLNEARKTLLVNTKFTETPNRMLASQDIIDKVIATNPRISKVDNSDTKLDKFSHWKSKEEHSLREDFEMVSETLAQLYITQGAHAKAREIYKTLSKTHPEKADYFTQLSKQRLDSARRPKSKIKNQKSKNKN